MEVRDPSALRRALGLVLLGTLLVFLDLRIDGVDLLPDVAGFVLVVVGIGRCRDAHPDGAYGSRVTAAWVLAWFCAVYSVLDLVHALLVLPHLYWLATVSQPVVTAYAFARLAQVAGPDPLHRSWVTSIRLLLAGLALVVVAIALRDNGFAVLTVLVAVGAGVHYLVSIARTRTALSNPAGVR